MGVVVVVFGEIFTSGDSRMSSNVCLPVESTLPEVVAPEFTLDVDARGLRETELEDDDDGEPGGVTIARVEASTACRDKSVSEESNSSTELIRLNVAKPHDDVGCCCSTADIPYRQEFELRRNK